MSTALLDYQPDQVVTKQAGPGNDLDIRAQVHSILSDPSSSPKCLDRRSGQRRAYPYLIHLTPVGDDGLPVRDEAIVAVGKQLSEHGLDFYYREPLPYRRMIASLQIDNGQFIGFLLDLTWCQFSGHGWYANGGRFLQVVQSPLASEEVCVEKSARTANT